MTFVPESPDWESLGDCEGCGGPLSEKPRKVRGWADKLRPCYRASDHICGARHGLGIETCDLRKRDCLRLSAQERKSRLGILPSKIEMAAHDVVKGIELRHSSPGMSLPEWLVLTEVQCQNRRLDVLALRLWQSDGFNLIGYEVKVARSDVDAELRTPSKRAPGMELCTQFRFATPVGLMLPEEVPDGCGLTEFSVDRRGKTHWHDVVPSPHNPTTCVPPQILYGIAYRLRDFQRRVEARGIIL